MVTRLRETSASADWLRARKDEKQLRKGRGFSDLIRSVVPVAEVDSGVLKSGRLRAYGDIAILSKADQEDELIIAGYASPQVVDREKHVITKEALAKDLPRFMAEPDYRNANLLHSNVQVGKVIPAWTSPDGKRYETKVDEIGLFVVVQIRTDAARPNICRRVAGDIRAGKLQAFSISADAPYESRRYECSEGTCFWVIDAVELYEVTVCETPVNQDAKFSILTKSYDLEGEFAPYMWCRDGSCPVTYKQARRTLQKAALPADWIVGKLDLSFGATEFSAHRNSGTLDAEKRSVLGRSAAQSEQQSDDPAAPLDLDFPWPARSGLKGRMPISFEEAFNLALSDPSGKLLLAAVGRQPAPTRIPNFDADLHNADWTKRADDTRPHRISAPLRKAKKYIKDPSQAPAGVKVEQGPQGGYYYESTGAAGGGDEAPKPKHVLSAAKTEFWNTIQPLMDSDPEVKKLAGGSEWEPLLDHPKVAAAFAAKGYDGIQLDEKTVYPLKTEQQPVDLETEQKIQSLKNTLVAMKEKGYDNSGVYATILDAFKKLGGSLDDEPADDGSLPFDDDEIESDDDEKLVGLANEAKNSLKMHAYQLIKGFIKGDVGTAQLLDDDQTCHFLAGKGYKSLKLPTGKVIPIKCGGEQDDHNPAQAPGGGGNFWQDDPSADIETNEHAEPADTAKLVELKNIAAAAAQDGSLPPMVAFNLSDVIHDNKSVEEILEDEDTVDFLLKHGVKSIKVNNGAIEVPDNGRDADDLGELKPGPDIAQGLHRQDSKPLEDMAALGQVDNLLAASLENRNYRSDDERVHQKKLVQRKIGARMRAALSDRLSDEDMRLVCDALDFTTDQRYDYNPRDNYEFFAAGMTNAWASSSSDHNFASVVMQQAVADVFDLPPLTANGMVLSPEIRQRMETIYAAKRGVAHAARAYVEACYAQTQQELEEAGIEEVPLVRGMNWNAQETPDWTKQLAAANTPKAGDTLPLPSSIYDADSGSDLKIADAKPLNIDELTFPAYFNVEVGGERTEVHGGLSNEKLHMNSGNIWSIQPNGWGGYYMYDETTGTRLDGDKERYDRLKERAKEVVPPARYFSVGSRDRMSVDEFKQAAASGEIQLENEYTCQYMKDGQPKTIKVEQDTMRRWSGGGGYTGQVKAKLNPISSFSTDYGTSHGFAAYGDVKAIAVSSVPRQRIFSKWGSGPGCLEEHELVVLGGEMTTDFHMVGEDAQLSNDWRQVNAAIQRSRGRLSKAVDVGLFPEQVRKAGYNLPNTAEDEDYYLNEQTGYLAITPDGMKPNTTGEPYGPETDVKLNKDNEASGFPPDSAYGQVVIGTDHPNEPVTQGKPKQPKLNPPITGTPSIMRSLDHALSEASYLRLSAPMGAIVHKARLDLADGRWPFEWDTSERLFGAPGRWITKGSALTTSALLTLLRNAAHGQHDSMALESLSAVRRQLNRARPLTLAQAGGLASALAARVGDSRLDKTQNPELALARVRDGVGKITRDPELRQRVPPRLLASLDSILEEAEGAIDGLQLGMTIGLAEDTKLAPRDPKVHYRPAETANEHCGGCRHFRDNGSCELVAGPIRPEMVCDLFAHGDPEHETIHNAGAGQTYRDVEKTDALLDAVNKAVAPQPTQAEAAVAARKDANAPQHTGAMIAHFLDSGAARQLAQEGGEAADELHITVVYLGEAADFTPEQQRKIIAIAQRHVTASPPIEAEITHIEHFKPSASSGGKTPVVAMVDADDLHVFREKLVADLEKNGIKIPHSFPTYKPHVTLYDDNPGMDDMQERGIPEVESTPIYVDRLSVTFAGKRHDLSFDAGGATQIHGKSPAEVRGVRKALRSGDEDARSYGALFSSMWSRGFNDPSYQLVVRKADGSLIDLNG